MKKFLVVLLSLGLLVAFAATASAVDVKFNGSYYVAGVYDNNPTLADGTGYSRAVFHNRFRLRTIFEVAQGLSLTTQFDALEKHWGDTRWKANFEDTTTSRKQSIASTGPATQENIEFSHAWITAKTAVGTFDIGYQDEGGWGTAFGNSVNTRPEIKYTNVFGPVTVGFVYDKWYEADVSLTNVGKVDADSDAYGVFGFFKWKGGDAGMLYKYYNDASQSTLAAAPFKKKVHLLSPYAKATFGPVYVETEVNYLFGKVVEGTGYDAVVGKTPDVDAESLAAYIKAQMKMGPAYFGGQLAYLTGDDPGDRDAAGVLTKKKAILDDGTGWGPALILGGSDRQDWLGGATGNLGGAVQTGNKMNNVIWYNVFAGFNPTPKLNVQADITYATAVKKPWTGVGAATVEYLSDKYGTEFDVRATYKIFDNLSYFVGAGYLWTGDYYKGTNAAAKVDNDYVLLNRLMLVF